MGPFATDGGAHCLYISKCMKMYIPIIKHCTQDKRHKHLNLIRSYRILLDLNAVDFLLQERAAERRVSKALQQVPGARLEVVPAAGGSPGLRWRSNGRNFF